MKLQAQGFSCEFYEIFKNTVLHRALKTFSSKPSRVDFNVVIDKPSKQESPRSSKIKNCPVIEVKQTVQHSDERKGNPNCSMRKYQ